MSTKERALCSELKWLSRTIQGFLPQKQIVVQGPTLSTSTSSFEALDPHDPNLSKLASSMFEKTAEYLHGELTMTQDHYKLLEEMNRVTITKYSDMRHIATNLSKTLTDFNEIYAAMIEPYLKQIDVIVENVSKFEQAAYRLDSYTKQLKAKFKDIEKR